MTGRTAACLECEMAEFNHDVPGTPQKRVDYGLCFAGAQGRHMVTQDRGFSCLDGGYFLGENAALSGGCLGSPPCLFDCADRGGANYKRVPLKLR